MTVTGLLAVLEWSVACPLSTAGDPLEMARIEGQQRARIKREWSAVVDVARMRSEWIFVEFRPHDVAGRSRSAPYGDEVPRWARGVQLVTTARRL